MKQTKIPLVATHIIGWLFFLSLPLVFLLAQARSAGIATILSSYAYWQFCFFYVIVFYVNTYVLLPLFVAKQRKALYVTLVLLLLFSVIKLQPFEQLMNATRNGRRMEYRMQGDRFQPQSGDHFQPGPGERFGQHGSGTTPNGNMWPRRENRVDIISIILFVMTITLSVAVDVTRRWRESIQRASRAETDKANAELSFLKAQINPHFLFNTLNNIYSMALTKNDNTADMIMKLSNIMRYVTDDVNEDYVSLQSEVDCITDYIDLQKLRLGKKVTLHYTVTGDPADKKIAPLILMTFIENLFKYGTSNHEQTELTINLEVMPERIHFFTQNKLFATEHKLERTGIGIDNTKKRLEHLYPGKHELQIIKGNGLFRVELLLYD